MYKVFFTVMIALTYSPPSHAGFERGNGGNIVFCANETHPMFLDYYIFVRNENKFIFPSLSPTNGTAIEKALQVIQPLYLHSTTLADRLRKTILDFESESYFVSDMPRVVVNDESISALLETYRCNLHQLIFQRNIPTAEGVRYFISQQHWKILDEDQKATAIVHEAVLREFMGKENFFYKDPVLIIVKGLLGYSMFEDISALHRAELQFDVLTEF